MKNPPFLNYSRNSCKVYFTTSFYGQLRCYLTFFSQIPLQYVRQWRKFVTDHRTNLTSKDNLPHCTMQRRCFDLYRLEMGSLKQAGSEITFLISRR